MARRKTPPKKSKRITSPCALCGAEIETVWMKDGSVKAVEAERVRVIFTNMAQADGREMLVWVPHHKNCEENR
jgi:hypothetical protein